MGKGRSLRSGRTLPNPDLPSRDDFAESESPEADSADESVMEVVWEDDSDSTASSDISDWTAEAGIDLKKSLRKRRK